MPVYFLTDELYFPHPSEALEDGLLALGGDLRPERILKAYESGIFPWFSEGSPILWWSTDPRMVLFPNDFKITKSLQQIVNSKKYEVRFDTNFKAVIDHCSKVPRKDQDGTWITSEMKEAYIELHKKGYCHSVETYLNGELAGGLYGISIGKVFFGESMFFLKRDASKVAFYHLVEKLKKWNFKIIDAQQETSHLKRMGAVSIDRRIFLENLREAVKEKTHVGVWN
ncbi:leucyl/phenylalanyl-tRNA--protein transferase [Bacteroidota bacterium]